MYKNTVTIDQEIKVPPQDYDFAPIESAVLSHRLVKCIDGIVSPLGEPKDIPEDSLILGDFNSLATRNGKSLSQAWKPEDFALWRTGVEARGCVIRQVSNFVFHTPTDKDGNPKLAAKGSGRIPGGPQAVRNLWRKATDNPEWAISASRPLNNRTSAQREESARLWEEALRDFRRAEDAQSAGVLPMWFPEVLTLTRELLTKQELDALSQSKTKDFANPRKLLAIYLSVRSIDGTVRLLDNGKPVTAEYAFKYIARLHGQARGKGGSIRAALRNIGRGVSPSKRTDGDRAFMKIARELLK